MAGARGDRKFRDLTVGCDARDLVGLIFREPDVAVGSRRDSKGTAVGRWDRELGDLTCGADAPDLVGVDLREPDIAVGARDDVFGLGVGGRNSVKLPEGVIR
jgi:hypothetical protein